MFSLYFLEIKSLTKIGNDKAKKDWKTGLFVILTVYLSYMLIYIVMIIGNAATPEDPE